MRAASVLTFARNRLKPLFNAAVAALLASAAVWVWTRDIGQNLDRWVLRKFFEIRGIREPPSDIILVAIDDESIAKLKADTMDSGLIGAFAEGLERIVNAAPKAVIIDARISSAATRCSANVQADSIIARALRNGPTTIWSGELPKDPSQVAVSSPSGTVALPSDEPFRKAAKMELPMWISLSNGVAEGISLSSTGPGSLYEQVPLARPLQELAGFTVAQPGRFDIINFYGPSGTIRRIPLHRVVLDEKAVLPELSGKVVLYGYQSVVRERGQMDKDEFMTAASKKPMFGVEIHANIVGNLIDQSWIRRLPLVTQLRCIFMVVLITSLLALAISPVRAFPLLLLINGGALAAAYVSFAHLRLWIPGVALLPLSSAVALYLGLLTNYWRLSRHYATKEIKQ